MLKFLVDGCEDKSLMYEFWDPLHLNTLELRNLVTRRIDHLEVNSEDFHVILGS